MTMMIPKNMNSMMRDDKHEHDKHEQISEDAPIHENEKMMRMMI